MTAQTLAAPAVDQRGSWFKRALSPFIMWASVAACVTSIVFFVMFLFASSHEANTATGELWPLILGFAAGVMYLAASLAYATLNTKHDSPPHQAIARLSRGYVSFAAAWWFVFALIPATAFSIVHAQPHVLQTAPGSIRVMYDGRVLAAGQAATSDTRYATSSSVTPIRRSASVRVGVRTPDGVVFVSGWFTFDIVPDAAFQASVIGHEREMSDNDYWAALASNAIAPSLETVVREVGAKDLSGARASMLLRTGQLVAQRARSSPSWMKPVSVKYIQVDGWAAANE